MKMRITVEGKTYEVDVEVLDGQSPAPGSSPGSASGAAPAKPAPAVKPAPAPVVPTEAVSPSGAEVRSPIAGVVLSIQAKPGDTFNENETLLVLEAMKMESNIASPVIGTIKEVHVQTGDNVDVDQLLVSFA